MKGEGNQQDYRMRIYDTRVGRFLSVDPLMPKYPELTPYQFASNRPIDGIDQDGLEYIPYIPKFKNSGNRTFSDYVGAFDNGVIEILNTVPGVWNAGVNAVKSFRRRTVVEDFKNDAIRFGNSVRSVANKLAKDPLKTLTSPEALELAVSAYVGSKILASSGNNKGNLLRPAVNETKTAESIGGSRDLNPLRGEDNCAGCTIAGDATLKGYPASALNHDITSLASFLKWFDASRMAIYNSPPKELLM